MNKTYFCRFCSARTQLESGLGRRRQYWRPSGPVRCRSLINYLRGAIVSGDDVRGHHECGSGSPCESKVEYFECAVGLDDDVAWLEVAVDDACGVEVLDPAEHLVQQVRHPLVVEVHVNDLPQIRIHQLHHQIHVLEILKRLLRRKRIQQPDYLQGTNYQSTVAMENVCFLKCCC
jgi:hypothetical protein